MRETLAALFLRACGYDRRRARPRPDVRLRHLRPSRPPRSPPASPPAAPAPSPSSASRPSTPPPGPPSRPRPQPHPTPFRFHGRDRDAGAIAMSRRQRRPRRRHRPHRLPPVPDQRPRRPPTARPASSSSTRPTAPASATPPTSARLYAALGADPEVPLRRLARRPRHHRPGPRPRHRPPLRPARAPPVPARPAEGPPLADRAAALTPQDRRPPNRKGGGARRGRYDFRSIPPAHGPTSTHTTAPHALTRICPSTKSARACLPLAGAIDAPAKQGARGLPADGDARRPSASALARSGRRTGATQCVANAGSGAAPSVVATIPTGDRYLYYGQSGNRAAPDAAKPRFASQPR